MKKRIVVMLVCLVVLVSIIPLQAFAADVNTDAGVVTLSARNYAKITTQPTNAAVPNGKTASVKVVASGDGLTYTWYYKNAGASSYSKSSTTSSTYSAQMNSARNGRKVYCVVKDKYGTSVKSDVVTLYMGSPAKITTQPTNAMASNGKTASVKVVASGDGLTYTWYYKNAGASSYSKSSTTSSTYSAQMNSARDGRKVYCVVKDKYGITVKSDVVTLYMGSPVKITTQPKSASAALNTTVSTKVVASGTGLKYTWYYKEAGASAYKKSSITTATYSTTMTTARSGRQVYCVVTDKFGNSVKSNVVTLSSKVAITTQPTNKSGEIGSVISIKVVASGEGKTYTWYYKNPGASTYSKSSITTATYSMKVTAANNGREVYCVVKDKYGNTATTNVVTLYAGTPVKITTQPVSVTVASGEYAKVSVAASGSGLTYTWYYKNSNASSFSKSSITSSTYSAQMNSARDGRQVYCVVTDKYGNSVTSETVTLHMRSVPSTDIGTIVGTWYSTDAIIDNSLIPASGVATLVVYDDGTACVFLENSSYSFVDISYNVTSDTYYYYTATSVDYDRYGYFLYEYVTDAMCIMVDASNMVFFER